MTTTGTERERAFYDEMWRRYGALDAASPAGFHRRRLIAELATAEAPAGAHVLDVGCGQGELLRQLAAVLPGACLAGADISETSLAETRARNPDFDLFLLDITAPDFAARHTDRLHRYDLVICSEVVEHLEDDTGSVKRLSELLRPGGALIVTVPGGKPSRFDHLIGHKRHYDRARLEALLAGAGFRVERLLAWGFPFHNLYRSAVRVGSRCSMRDATAAAPAPQDRTRLGDLLSKAYLLASPALKALFYLNLKRGGEQMLALGRTSGSSDAPPRPAPAG